MQPGGAKQFTKDVILLTNRFVASAGEGFAYMMHSLPHVRQVGDHPAGLVTRFPLDRELPNGWSYWCSVGLEYDADKKLIVEGSIPDFKVGISKHDSIVRRDMILEQAISLLK